MANTTNLNLVKPAGTDYALISTINDNMDKIDTFAGSTNQALGKLSTLQLITIGGVSSTSTKKVRVASGKTLRCIIAFFSGSTGRMGFYYAQLATNGYILKLDSHNTTSLTLSYEDNDLTITSSNASASNGYLLAITGGDDITII